MVFDLALHFSVVFTYGCHMLAVVLSGPLNVAAGPNQC